MKLEVLNKNHVMQLTNFFLRLDSISLSLMNRFGTRITKTQANILASVQCQKTNEKGFVVLIENKIVGYSFLKLNSAKERKHLANFGIILLKEFQSKGIGNKLIKFTLKNAKKLNLKKIWLATREDNIKARKLYEKNGFVVEGVFKKNIKQNNKFFDEISMAKWIK